MILKERDDRPASSLTEAAGARAERRMAHYLRREFGRQGDVLVINDLRLVHEGETAQIDHLCLHPRGLVLVESKSVATTVRVDGHGEWARLVDGRFKGMASPILQARRQLALLLDLLDGSAAPVSAGVRAWPSAVLVAVSDDGLVERGSAVPEILKADAVPDRLRGLFEGWTTAPRARGRQYLLDLDGRGAAGWSLARLDATARFLLARHAPRLRPPARRAA